MKNKFSSRPSYDDGLFEWMEIDRKEKMSKTKTSKIEIIQISKTRSNENECRSK